MKMVVACSLLVEVLARGGILTMAGSWYWENVITPYSFLGLEKHKYAVRTKDESEVSGVK